MVKKLNSENASRDKLDVILDAAQKRFGHYGLSKTTMNEIAEDIGMSKASLYYYFKDKESIFRAVTIKEQQFFIDEMHKIMSKPIPAETMLKGYVDLRLDLLKKLLTLGKFSYGNYQEVKPVLHALFHDFKKKEIEMIEEILHKGKADKNFISGNKVNAELFVDALRGLRQVALTTHVGNEVKVMSDTEYLKLKKQSRLFTELFVKGISVR